MENFRNSLSSLKTAAINLAAELLKIDDDREQLIKSISSSFSVENAEPIYEKVYEDISEGVIESIGSDNFFIETEKGLVADKQQTFLYNLWSGDYYGDCRSSSAFLRFAKELEERMNVDFLEECRKYSL